MNFIVMIDIIHAVFMCVRNEILVNFCEYEN